MLRKPWNLPSYAVYSLITYSKEETINMNIMTYAIPVSMHPKRYIIALYHNTQSLENWNLKQRVESIGGLLVFCVSIEIGSKKEVKVLGESIADIFKKRYPFGYLFY